MLLDKNYVSPRSRRRSSLSLHSRGSALAQKKYDTGATDTEIKIGNIMPYSGPASAYGVIGKTEEAYFKKINAEGGINGRKINFITYDDGYSPPKAVEQARKLVESDEVLAGVQSARHAVEHGDPEIPELRRRCRNCSSPPAPPSGTIPKDFPWTMGWQPSPTRAKRGSTRNTC